MHARGRAAVHSMDAVNKRPMRTSPQGANGGYSGNGCPLCSIARQARRSGARVAVGNCVSHPAKTASMFPCSARSPPPQTHPPPRAVSTGTLRVERSCSSVRYGLVSSRMPAPPCTNPANVVLVQQQQRRQIPEFSRIALRD